ncbi:hypothetical protein V8C43DRAFT_14095 [Trichoderma afarasin]
MSETFTYAKEDANITTRYAKGYLQRVYERDVTTKYGYEGRIRPPLPINVVLADCADCQVCGTEIYGDKDIRLQTGIYKLWSPEMANPQMKFAISATTNAIASNRIHKNEVQDGMMLVHSCFLRKLCGQHACSKQSWLKDVVRLHPWMKDDSPGGGIPADMAAILQVMTGTGYRNHRE